MFAAVNFFFVCLFYNHINTHHAQYHYQRTRGQNNLNIIIITLLQSNIYV